MSAKPTSVARWADVGGAIVIPPSGKQDVGWVPGEAPPAEYFNWIENLAYQWQKWLYDGNCTFANLAATGTFAVTGASTFTTAGFSGLLTASAGITIPTDQALTLAGTATLTVGGASTFTGAATFNGTAAFVGVASFAGGITGGVAFGGLITANAGITIPTGQALTLSGTASATIGGSLTVTGAATMNGNTTLGASNAQTCTVNAVTTHNANATMATGTTLTMTDGASALKGMTRHVKLGLWPGRMIPGSTAATSIGTVGSRLAASCLYWCVIEGISDHETVTGVQLFCNDATSAGRLTLSWQMTDQGGQGLGTSNMTGVSFSASSNIITMSGTPPVTNTGGGAGGRMFYLQITVSAAGTADVNSIGLTLTT